MSFLCFLRSVLLIRSLLASSTADPSSHYDEIAGNGADSGVSYMWDAYWPKDNATWMSMEYRPTAMAVDMEADGKPMEIHMAARGNTEHPITTFDRDGNVLRRWGQPHIVKAHGLKLKMEDNTSALWVADMGDYTVKKFDAKTGKLLHVIGTPGTSGISTNPLQFGNVSDIAFSSDGSMIFIADGDCLCLSGGANHRVVAMNMRTLSIEWVVGNDGTFQNPHAIDYDAKRHWVWIADREHNRTVALDATSGHFKGAWSTHDLPPSSHRPSINGLRLLHQQDMLILGLMPAPIHSKGGDFEVAVLPIDSVVASANQLPLPAYQKAIPVNGLHELDVDQRSGDLYLALYEVGQVAHLGFQSARMQLDSAACNNVNDPPTILSHHVHVLFHGADSASMTAALERRKEFLLAMGLDGTNCPMAHSDPAPTYSGICPFPFEFDPSSFPVDAAGPFEAPNFSFFVSDAYLQKAITWWQSHRRYLGGELDVLVHANSGCQLNDHTVFGIWMGSKWEMNTAGLACCLHGAPGCFCYDTYYVSRESRPEDNGATRCLTVNKTQGDVVFQTCNLSAFDPDLMWHEVTYQKGFQQIDSLGYSMGRESGVDNCMGAPRCQEGAELSMTQCRLEDVAGRKSRFHFAGGAGNTGIGVLLSDSCAGLCLLIDQTTGRSMLGDCKDRRAAVERRCIMAPGQPPVACPQKMISDKMLYASYV